MMPFDPFFSSSTTKMSASLADEAERTRLHKVPFTDDKKKNPYNLIKTRMLKGEKVSRGEFLFVRDIDQKRNWKKANKWRELTKQYLGGNVVSNGFMPSSDGSVGQQAHVLRRP